MHYTFIFTLTYAHLTILRCFLPAMRSKQFTCQNWNETTCYATACAWGDARQRASQFP